jgi:hypothetical protein
MSTESHKKSDNKKLSLNRIVIGIIIAVFLLSIVLIIDEHYAYMDHYQDLKPMWSPDGNYLVFVRWHARKNHQNDFFEIWKVDPDGTNFVCLYQTTDKYNAQGIRKLGFSDNGHYLEMRINGKNYDGAILDKLVRIPVDGQGDILEWELEKNHVYDIFLTFRNDRVIMRRIIPDNSYLNCRVVEYSFSDRKSVREYQIPENSICVEADFYGPEEKFIGQLVVNQKGKNGGIKNSIYDFENNKAYPLFNLETNNTLYVKKQNSLIFSTAQITRNIYILDLSTSKTKIIELPDKHFFNRNLKISRDESMVITSFLRSIVLVNLKNMEMKTIPVPDVDSMILDLDISSNGKSIVLSDLNCIFIVDMQTGKAQAITEISPKSKYLKNHYYRTYLDFRHKLMGKH